MIDVAKLPRIFVYSISIIVTLALPPFRAACAGTTFGATVKHLGLGQMLRRRSGPHWVRAEDPENSDTLTLSSLVMSSSLIAVVRPEGTFATINHGILRTDYKVVRLERIISNTFANVRDLSVNSHIIIADQLMADGAEFADDMVPGRGERVLVFLRRLPMCQDDLEPGPIEIFT